MKANKLRVGNCILIDGQEFGIISEIRSNHAKVIYKGEVNGNISTRFSLIEFIRLAPIPLTDEWLVRFGFEKYTWMDGYFIKTKFGYLMIQFYKNEIHLYFTNIGADKEGMKMRGRKYVGNINSTQNIIHVHQLQNLYFALTGDELKLTDK